MIEDKIEIVIPTYNRAEYLDKTLSYLLNSPFKDCKITIRDNASSDNTPRVCEKYSKLFNNILILRNRNNIGGSANILKSYEKATYPYVWVLADNDYLDFSQCDDLIESIESNKYDIIICSSGPYVTEDSASIFNTPKDEPISEYIKRTKKNKSNYLENNAKDLAFIIERYFFLITTCISTTIYKTSLIDSETIIKGYDYIHLTYPHYPIIAKVLNNNLLTYKTKKDIVFEQENPNSYWGSGFEWYVNYLECSFLIKDKKIQSFAVQIHQHPLNFIINQITIEKKLNVKTLKNNILRLIKITCQLNGKIKGLIYILYILICYFIPIRLVKVLVRLKKKFK